MEKCKSLQLQIIIIIIIIIINIIIMRLQSHKKYSALGGTKISLPC